MFLSLRNGVCVAAALINGLDVCDVLVKASTMGGDPLWGACALQRSIVQLDCGVCGVII